MRKATVAGTEMTTSWGLKTFTREVQATIIDRRMRGAWEKRGSKSLIQSANEKAAALLSTHEPKPLNEDLIQELKRIVKSAE